MEKEHLVSEWEMIESYRIVVKGRFTFLKLVERMEWDPKTDGQLEYPNGFDLSVQ